MRVLVLLLALLMPAVAWLSNTGTFGPDNGTVSNQYPTLLVAAGYAFAIWGLIFLLDAVFAVQQLRARDAAGSGLDRARLPAALGFALTAAWMPVFSNQAFLPALAIIWLAKKVLPNYPGINLVATVYGDDLADKSYREAQGLIQTYPDLKAIIAPTTVGILAASQAVTDALHYVESRERGEENKLPSVEVSLISTRSDKTAKAMDEEAKAFVDRAYERTLNLLNQIEQTKPTFTKK